MSSKSKTTQTSKPWEPAAESLESGLAEASNLYNDGGFEINPYAGDWVANQNDQTLAGQNGLLSVLQGGQDLSTPINTATQIASQSTAPTIQNSDAMRNTVLESIMPALNGTFAGSGMTGSSLHAANLAKGVTSGMAEQELGIQQARANEQQALRSQALQASSLLPSMISQQQSADASPYQAMIDFGNQTQAQEQAEIDALMQQDLMSQTSQATALKDYLSLLSSIGGQFGTSTGTTKTPLNPLSVVGGITQGIGLFS